MSRAKDKRMQITPGKQHASLIFVNETQSRSGNRYGIFSCVCGRQKEISIKSVLYGQQKSCGCMGTNSKEKARISNPTIVSRHPRYVTDEMIGLIASPFDFSLTELNR